MCAYATATDPNQSSHACPTTTIPTNKNNTDALRPLAAPRPARRRPRCPRCRPLYLGAPQPHHQQQQTSPPPPWQRPRTQRRRQQRRQQEARAHRRPWWGCWGGRSEGGPPTPAPPQPERPDARLIGALFGGLVLCCVGLNLVAAAAVRRASGMRSVCSVCLPSRLMYSKMKTWERRGGLWAVTGTTEEERRLRQRPAEGT